MKQSFILLLFLSIYCKFAFSQSVEKLPVPVLKESVKIDSLMDIVLNPNNPDKFERVKVMTDSCFTISLIKRGPYCSFQIESISEKIANIFVNRSVKYKVNFGYFTYKKYKIFVWTRDYFYDFFSKTPANEMFSFIYQTDNITPPQGEYFLTIWHYQYEDGNWAVEGPPSVK